MPEYTADDAYAAAAKGAAWMDKHCEGWTLLIDLEKLSLESSSWCVLGQTAHCVTKGATDSNLHHSYYNAVDYAVRRAQHRAYISEDSKERWAVKHGFMAETASYRDFEDDEEEGVDRYTLADEENQTRWEMLNIAWKEEIRKRSEVTA